MPSHQINPEILREYDIRGVVGRTLDAGDARAIGRAFGTMVLAAGGSHVVVGRDGRLSSPSLYAAVIEGLSRSGCTVTGIGCGPTPMLYFAAIHLGADAGIMVTGSHNPPDFNGFKLIRGALPVFGDALQRLGRIAAEGSVSSGHGRTAEADVAEAYVDRLVQRMGPLDRLSVGWDAGNGAAGAVAAALLQRIGGGHRLIHGEIDGRFPNHHPDPTVPENLADLRALVLNERLDAGIAFDGDGDRIGVVDGEGQIIWGDQIVALLAREVLPRHPGATIIGDVKSSRVLFDEITRLGGKPMMWKTGHALIKQKMHDTGSPLAGEMSAHIYIGDDYYGFDDALYAALRFLRVAAGTPGGAVALRRSIPVMINTPEIRIECSEATKFRLVDDLRDRLRREGQEFIAIDGVRAEFPDGWWLVRASNTQPILVARAEAVNAAAFERVTADLRRRVLSLGLVVPVLDNPAAA